MAANTVLLSQTSTTTGTGALTLAPVAAGVAAVAWATRYTPGGGETFEYLARGTSGACQGQWEWGTGRIASDGTLERLALLGSSTGAAVDFLTGTKAVYEPATPSSVTALATAAATAVANALAVNRYIGHVDLEADTITLGLALSDKCDQRRAVAGAVTVTLGAVDDGADVNFTLTNSSGADRAVTFTDTLNWLTPEPTVIPNGATMKVALHARGTTAADVDAAFAVTP